jgi:sec-independent protein translocase protein TatC
MDAAGIETPVLDELESHLRDDVEQRVRSGMSVQQACETAARRIGQAAALQAEFEKAGRAKRLRGSRYLLRAFGIVMGVFITGVTLCYFIILPLALRANGHYASWLGMQSPRADVGSICRFVLGMGLALAIPAGMLTLARTGILNHRRLANLRRHTIVANLILGAALTSPEVVNQIMLFVPLQLLCELSIWIALLWERKTKRNQT